MPPSRSEPSSPGGPGVQPPRQADPRLLVDRDPPQAGLLVWLPRATATVRLGRVLAADAQPGDLLSLAGPLGAGKTCLVGGLARGLGITGTVASPSFSLVNQHSGRLTLYHVDLYRIGHESELSELGLWEAAEAGGVLAIEWLERFPDAVSRDRLQIDLRYAAGDPLAPPPSSAGGRLVRITSGGPRSAARLAALATRLAG